MLAFAIFIALPLGTIFFYMGGKPGWGTFYLVMWIGTWSLFMLAK